MGNKMFCIHCGAPIMPTDAFCTKCGKAIELPKKNYCIHCGAVLNSGDAFCIMCGAPVKQQKPEKSGGTKDKPPMQKPEQRCEKCGAVLPLGAKKCVKCGKKVKRKASKGKVVRRVIAAVLVAALLAGLWKRGMMPWDLLRKDKTVELQAGQTVQSGEIVHYADAQGETVRGADHARKTIAGTLGIHAENLGECKKSEVQGDSFYRFAQTYNGIPVYGRDAILAAESNGDTIGVFGNYMELDQVNTEPVISDEEARKTLQRKLGDFKVRSVQLTIYTLYDHKPELAWHYEVISDKLNGNCLVSAETGKVLFQDSFMSTVERAVEGSGSDHSGVNRTFGTVLQDNGQYRLEDTRYNIKMFNSSRASITDFERIRANGSVVDVTLKNDSKEVILPATNNSTQWSDPDAVTIMHQLTTTYRYFDDVLAVEGFHYRYGENSKVYVTYNDGYGGDPANAGSASDLIDDGIMLIAYGYDCPITLNTLAHEYTHGVENAISAMVGRGESGSLKEAYSDVFAEFVEAWENGEEGCDWENGYRNLKRPEKKTGPTIYEGFFWGDPNSDFDDGYEHRNSTVISHAIYNMCREDNLFTDALTEEQMAELLYYLLFTLPSDCSMKTFAEQLMYFAKLDREADAMSESQLLTVHLALVRAGLIKLDLSLLPEFNMIRIIAECMAACVPQSLLDYIGITRDELAELYYQQLTVYWIQLNDPDIRNALEDMWRYVIYGEPLDIEIN